MFRAFKKKSKPSPTPTFGSASKSKSLFSLTRSADKRRSVSSVALDQENPVQTLSLHYQLGNDLSLDTDTTHNNNNNRRGFSSFLIDDIAVSGNPVKQNDLPLDRSRSVDDLDQAGRTKDDRAKCSYLPKEENSASVFLEQIRDETHGQCNVTKFSTFKLSEAGGPDSAPENNSRNLSEETVSIGKNIPVPEDFADPDTDVDCLSRLPSEFDAVSVRSSQYEASVIMPPLGFIDMLHQFSVQKSGISEDDKNNVDLDNIRIMSSVGKCSEKSDTENDKAEHPSAPHASLPSQEECPRNSTENSYTPVHKSCAHPVLPPKPNFTNSNKYKPGYKSYGVHLEMSDCEVNCDNTKASHMENLEPPTIGRENLKLETSQSETVIKDISMAQDASVLNSKPTPPPRRNKVCTNGKLVLDEDITTSGEAIELTSEETPLTYVNKISDYNKEDDVINATHEQCSSKGSLNNSVTAMGKNHKLMQGPMVSSLREHLKRSPIRATACFGQHSPDIRADQLPSGEFNGGASIEITGKTHAVQPYQNCPAIKEKNQRELNGEGSCCDASFVDNTDATGTDPVRTSSHLSEEQDADVCSMSTINESQHVYLSDSFLDDTTLSSHEAEPADNCDLDGGKIVMANIDQRHKTHVSSDIRARLDYTMSDSIGVQISDSFLNDTVTQMLNLNNSAVSTQMNDAVIIEGDYIPPNLTLTPKQKLLKENPSDQPWEVSMAMSWALTKPNMPKQSAEPDLDTGSKDVESIDSESIMTEEDEEHQQISDIYRWELKPFSLWDTEDICQWLESKDLEIFKSVIRG